LPPKKGATGMPVVGPSPKGEKPTGGTALFKAENRGVGRGKGNNPKRKKKNCKNSGTERTRKKRISHQLWKPKRGGIAKGPRFRAFRVGGDKRKKSIIP